MTDEPSNDVLSDKFESKMDDLFKSSYKPPKRRIRHRTWNGLHLGLGQMPVAAASEARKGKIGNTTRSKRSKISP